MPLDIRPLELDIQSIDIQSTLDIQPATKPIDWREELKKTPWHKYVPVTGGTVEMLRMGDVYLSQQRILEDAYPQDYEGEIHREFDRDRVSDYFEKLNEEQERGLTWKAKVVRGVSQLPAWMGLFMLTGGLAAMGKRAGQKAGKKLLGRYIKTKAGKATVDLAGWGLGGAARTTIGMPHRVATSVLQRRVTDEGWATSITKGWAEVFIEAASEEAGGAIVKGLSKLPFASRFTKAIRSAWTKLAPKNTGTAFAKRFFTKAGYHGIIGEIGEERLATILHSIANTNDFGAGKDANVFERLTAGMVSDLQNLPVELAVLSVPGTARFALGKAAGALLPTEPTRIAQEGITPARPTDIAPKPIGAKPEAEATKGQKARAHIIARERGLTEKEFHDLAEKPMTQMSYDEAEDFINRLQPKERQPVILPQEPQLRKSYQKNLELQGTMVKRRGDKIKLRETKGKDLNLMNPWPSARYAFGEAELQTNKPLRREYENIVFKSNQARRQAEEIITQTLREAGVTPFSVAMNKQQNDQIASWLFEENPEKRQRIWSQMDEGTKGVSGRLHDLFQGVAANEIREAMWRIWNRGGAQPPNAPDSALDEGRLAQSQDRLKEWIASQTWGTREFYYMSERQIQDLAESLATLQMSLSIEEKEAKAGAQPRVPLPEARTRKGTGRAKGGSVINATLNHLERVMTANAVADDLEQFWQDFSETKPSRSDINLAREFIDNALGKRRRADPATKIARGVGRWSWRFYFLNPMKSTWFVTRNLIQNIAWGPSQLSLREWAKSAARLTKEKLLSKENPERADAFTRDWKIKISQKRQMYRQFLLQDEGNITREVGNRGVILMDIVGQSAALSDEANRLMAWPVMYDAAQRAANLYNTGKLSYNKVNHRLKIGTMHLSQQMELEELLGRKNYPEFQAKYAQYKTENIHFRYETSFRSGAEQTPAGRAFMGLVTYPRGVFELAYQNSVKPFMQGVQKGNWSQAWQGLTGMAMLFAGGAVAKRIIKEIAGRTAYGLWQTVFAYAPLGLGAGKIMDFFDNLSEAIRNSERNKWSLAKTADSIMRVAVYNLEFFIPLCDIYLNYYENRHDVAGVRLWSLLKKKAYEEYYNSRGKRFRRSDRAFWEKVQHQIFGGTEYPEERRRGQTP